MMVIIIGCNRAEMCKVRTVDLDRHFYQSRNQLYKVYPDGLSRIRIVEAGKKEVDDEVVVFAENCRYPYHARGLDYSLDTILREIDQHKLMQPHGLLAKYKIWFGRVGSVWRQIVPWMGLMITGVIVAWAFLTG